MPTTVANQVTMTEPGVKKAFAAFCHAAQIRAGLRQQAGDSDGLKLLHIM
jgi:hypothetical protein